MAKLQLPKIERTRKDYWKVGPVYVWKWIVLTVLAGISVLVIARFGLPDFSPSSHVPPSYYYNDPKLAKTAGVVRILDENNVKRYEGEVAAGSYTGHGKVYDADGCLVYDGPLADGVYEGADAKVYRDGNLVYAGEMAQNLYEGQGRRNNWKSGTVSEGQFSKGLLEGEGQEFYQDGTLLRSGTFSADLLNGSGMEYGRNGYLLREGDFVNGLLHGQGIQYTEDGKLRYEGEFQRGVYHGQGKLYDPLLDAMTYEGTFKEGRAIGQGQIFHPSGQVLYEGMVFDGQPRADAFLGLSLAEVESAFAEHWLLYSGDNVTAFVYPYFQLMFITEDTVELRTLSAEEADAAPNKALSPDTVKADLVICEVLSFGGPLPGTAQPQEDAPADRHQLGWREQFSGYAAGMPAEDVTVVQTGPFVYEFLAESQTTVPFVEEHLAAGGGVQTMTVWREDKESSLWYQSAVREDQQ